MEALIRNTETVAGTLRFIRLALSFTFLANWRSGWSSSVLILLRKGSFTGTATAYYSCCKDYTYIYGYLAERDVHGVFLLDMG